MTEIVLKEKPTVTINEVNYTLRRLGIKDVFGFAKILGPSIHVLASTLASGNATSEEAQKQSGANLIATIITLVPDLEQPLTEFVASVIGVQQTALEDPDVFPLSSLDELWQALSTHPDMKSFLERLRPLVLGGNKAPSAKTPLPSN